MIIIDELINDFTLVFPDQKGRSPWEITDNLKIIIIEYMQRLGGDFEINDGIAIHESAVVEPGVIIKQPAIIGPDCRVSAHAYFREGVFLHRAVKIGPGCEIKNSIIFAETAIAHFNYVGNSIIGSQVNFEAGSIAANHYNERTDKVISVKFKSKIISTGIKKFGALVGDHSRIGANAVLSPGTILDKNAIIRRLELVEQLPPE